MPYNVLVFYRGNFDRIEAQYDKLEDAEALVASLEADEVPGEEYEIEEV